MILGVVLAGGQSRRFGSDKAEAVLDGRTLLEHAVAALGEQCDRVLISGREMAGLETLPDWPRAGLGPLAGIAAGLRLAQCEGHAQVLTCGVDSVGLPTDLLARLSPSPAHLAAQPVVGLWPADALATAEQMLTGDGRRSVIAFASAIAARPVALTREPANINTQADLAALDDALNEPDFLRE